MFASFTPFWDALNTRNAAIFIHTTCPAGSSLVYQSLPQQASNCAVFESERAESVSQTWTISPRGYEVGKTGAVCQEQLKLDITLQASTTIIKMAGFTNGIRAILSAVRGDVSQWHCDPSEWSARLGIAYQTLFH